MVEGSSIFLCIPLEITYNRSIKQSGVVDQMNEDVKIIRRILRGEKDLYAMLMEKYHKELFSYIYNLVGQVQTTEDLLQDIFLKIYRKLHKFDEEKAGFRTWMYRIAHNHVINHLKSSKVQLYSSNIEEIDVLEADEDIEDAMIREEKINQVIKAIEKRLKKKHKDIMYLHYFSGLSVKEVSEVLDIPDKTIYHAIDSSIAKIKEEVE